MLDGAKSRSEVRNFTFQLGETHSYRLHFDSNVACVELKFKERQLQQEIHISKHSDVREFVPPPLPPSGVGRVESVSMRARGYLLSPLKTATNICWTRRGSN